MTNFVRTFLSEGKVFFELRQWSYFQTSKLFKIVRDLFDYQTFNLQLTRLNNFVKVCFELVNYYLSKS